MLNTELKQRPTVAYSWQGVNVAIVLSNHRLAFEIQIIGGEPEDHLAVERALADMGYCAGYRNGEDLGSDVIADKTLMIHNVSRPMDTPSEVWQELTAALKLSYT